MGSVLVLAALLMWAASWYEQLQVNNLAIYPAKSIVTMVDEGERFEAIAVENGIVVALGTLAELEEQFSSARVDPRFSERVIYPGFIDPHVHLMLAAIQYATKMAPPWDMPVGGKVIKALKTPDEFLKRLEEIVSYESQDDPIIVYGYHDLVHGRIDRDMLDAISPDKALIVWHYSSHDLYLNSAALEWVEITPAMSELYEGVDLDEAGRLTGRIYEDAAKSLLGKLSKVLLDPRAIRRGYQRFASLLEQGGVTTVAELGYGLFNEFVENTHLLVNWRSVSRSGFRVYLVPEYRALEKQYGTAAVERVQRWVSGEDWVPAPVLPQVKFFSDGAFYSQTMRLTEPGYLAGQSVGTQGLWVTPPESLTNFIKPFWDAGLGVRVHSNGDASQVAVLDTLAELRQTDKDLRFVIEHAGIFSPESVRRAAELGAAISAASHYVYYLGDSLQAPLESPRNEWILPLASHFAAENKVTVHSDAPLAPPLPLVAASVHVTRAVREGGVLNPEQALTRFQALRTITSDAAYALGLEHEIGTLAIGRKADLTILQSDPMSVGADDWPEINIIARIVAGKLHLNNDTVTR